MNFFQIPICFSSANILFIYLYRCEFLKKMLKTVDFDKKNDLVDTMTPRHTHLCGRYKKSSAYYELNVILPVVLTETIDDLIKYKGEIFAKYGEKVGEDLKKIIGQLSKLKYQLQTNKSFEHFTGNEGDCQLWNDFVNSLSEGANTFYRSPWMYSECYIYRKIASFFRGSNALKTYDYFQKKKIVDLPNNYVIYIARYLRHAENDFKTFQSLLKLNLWSNRFDEFVNDDDNGRAVFWDVIDSWDNNIVINHFKLIWKCLQDMDPSSSKIVDIACDNGGFELYMDIILAEHLIEKQLANKVRFHLKAMPWFVLNATAKDFSNIVNFIQEQTCPIVQEQGQKWMQYLENGTFSIAPMDYFWNSPYEYYKMRDFNLSLYNYLSQTDLIIFKGDVHYRKLLGDYSWDATEDFLTCIRGFLPSNFCILRVLQSDIICGMPHARTEELQRVDSKWMTNGAYAVVQFVEKTDCGCRLKKNISSTKLTQPK